MRWTVYLRLRLWVCTNYSAMNVATGRMNKIFINHLHGDHMSDLTHVYCFGPSQDRKSPLYVFGQKVRAAEPCLGVQLS